MITVVRVDATDHFTSAYECDMSRKEFDVLHRKSKIKDSGVEMYNDTAAMIIMDSNNKSKVNTVACTIVEFTSRVSGIPLLYGDFIFFGPNFTSAKPGLLKEINTKLCWGVELKAATRDYFLHKQ